MTKSERTRRANAERLAYEEALRHEEEVAAKHWAVLHYRSIPVKVRSVEEMMAEALQERESLI